MLPLLLALSYISNADEFYAERRVKNNWQPSNDLIWTDSMDREKWFLYEDGAAIASEDRYLSGMHRNTGKYVEYRTLRQILNRRYERWQPIERPMIIKKEHIYSAPNYPSNYVFWFSVHAFSKDADPYKFVIYRDGKLFRNCHTKEAAVAVMNITTSAWNYQYVRTCYLIKTKAEVSLYSNATYAL